MNTDIIAGGASFAPNLKSLDAEAIAALKISVLLEDVDDGLYQL